MPRTPTLMPELPIPTLATGALEPDELALLEEDLRSPCTEEIAVFRAELSGTLEG